MYKLVLMLIGVRFRIGNSLKMNSLCLPVWLMLMGGYGFKYGLQIRVSRKQVRRTRVKGHLLIKSREFFGALSDIAPNTLSLVFLKRAN